jgi:coenzyme F420-reducing hydrogenase alpha subunit
MNGEKTIKVHHMTRVEGHGNFEIRIRNGRVEQCEWQVVEAPRFFEAMLRGRKWYEVAHITSRICGICSIGHTLTSLKATEKAMGIAVSEQTEKLRKLLTHAENLQSHVLHVGYLVLPDLLQVPSVLSLASTHREQVLTVFRLHRLANEMSDLIGGRTTHPQRPVVGGFARWPAETELESLRNRLTESTKDAEALAHLVRKLANRFPQFERETEYIALKSLREYALYDGDIASTDGSETWPVEKYKEITNEYLVPQSTAKFAKHNRDAYMVGALARFNLSYDQLSPKAKEVANAFDIKPIIFNPYMNSVVQLIEVFHSIEESIGLIDDLLRARIKDEKPSVAIKAGRGTGSVEVPRGILFHEYEYNKYGECVWADCVIPTNQNHGNIQRDMEALVPRIVDRDEKEIEMLVEMLVRAYDPCISCSTHCIFL